MSEHVHYGTPFEDAVKEDSVYSKKKLKPHEMPVLDEKGRRRFHGAFTGGFSAGYFNTVGSEKGWLPSTFKSGSGVNFKPEDFMDEEDYGEFGILGSKITTKTEFSAEKNSNNFKSIVAAKDLLVKSEERIGQQLLIKMGWKPGQGIGPRVPFYRKKERNLILKEVVDEFSKDKTFAPEYVEVAHYIIKQDTFGLGYSRLQNNLMSSKFTVKDQKNKILMIDAIPGGALDFSNTFRKINTKDVYDDYDLPGTNYSEYDQTLEPLIKKDKKQLKEKIQIGKDNKVVISGFVLGTERSIIFSKTFPSPKVPDSFIETHNFEFDHVAFEQHQKNLSIDERAKLLGMEKKRKDIFSYLRKEDYDRLMDYKLNKEKIQKSNIVVETKNIKTENNTKTQYISIEIAKEALKKIEKVYQDEEKQNRYNMFLLQQSEGNFILEQIWDCSRFTEWAHLQEIQEFTRAATIFRPMNESFSNRFVTASIPDNILGKASSLQATETPQTVAAKSGHYGYLTRTTFDWYPNKLLCKRLFVVDPYPSSKYEGIPREGKKEVQLVMTEEKNQTSMIEEQSWVDEESEMKKPSIEIFKSIFENFDDNLDEEVSETEDVDFVEEKTEKLNNENNEEKNEIETKKEMEEYNEKTKDEIPINRLGTLIDMSKRDTSNVVFLSKPKRECKEESDCEWIERTVSDLEKVKKKKKRRKDNKEIEKIIKTMKKLRKEKKKHQKK